MTKFNIGDKFVFVQSAFNNPERARLIGQTFTVKDFNTHDEDGPHYQIEENSNVYFIESEIVSEEIYQAPLYQALK